MSAVIKEAECFIRPMCEEDVPDVIGIETRAYEFPWSDTIFRDCLRVGYCCWVLERENVPAAYCVMSVAVGESCCCTCWKSRRNTVPI